jgi:hypothetical protein
MQVSKNLINTVAHPKEGVTQKPSVLGDDFGEYQNKNLWCITV